MCFFLSYNKSYSMVKRGMMSNLITGQKCQLSKYVEVTRHLMQLLFLCQLIDIVYQLIDLYKKLFYFIE